MATARKTTKLGMGAAPRTTLPPASGPVTVRGEARHHTTPMEATVAPKADALPEIETLVPSEPVPPPKRDSSVKRREREALSVDDVGDAAVRIASRAKRVSGVRPKILVPARVLLTANLTREEAYIATLLDGHLTIEEIIDGSALGEDLVQAAIAKLVKLGLVKL